MRLKQDARALKKKSLSSMRAAMTAFNSPHDDGRVTDVLLRLQHAFAGRTNDPLLPTRTGRAMDRHAVWRLLRRLAANAVPDKAGSLHPHDLRHAFVTLALDTGASLRDVQDAAGHANPRTARHNLDRHPTYALAGLLP
ncbi:tyrosine-type recombinase/integrase [Pseudokineococcus sp. 1T1Z-3]|uniref:tyrosine-type recombinase/integrase n=1 Tax=Pseudokineococcus sp. 1T1Z-3 TaxID=3132745 RepID=UPI0030B7D6AE